MTFEELVALGGAWAWANYGREVIAGIGKKIALLSGDKAKEAIETGWERVEWKSAAKKYREQLREQHGTTRIIGKPSPVRLEGIFTDVFILDRPTAFTRFDINQLRSDPKSLESSLRRVDGLEIVREGRGSRLFILGKPGAGKTTFLKYLTMQATEGILDKIPIFVSMKEWGDSALDLMPFLCKQFKICGFPDAQPFVERILEKGIALVMFDGLDEVTQEGRLRDTLISEVRDFSNQYPKTQCLITCRIAATQYIFEKFTYVELADFTEQQIFTYVNKWFAEEPKKLELFLEEFEEPRNEGLRELGKLPLLLSLLCLSFEETLTFPHRRSEIYDEALEALLKKWDVSRSIKRDEIYRGMTAGRKRQMLSRIATRSFQLNEYFIPQKKLSKYIVDYLNILPEAASGGEIDGDAVLKAIEAQHGILVERARQIYSFSHLSLQEHLTAKYICDNASREVLFDLLKLGNVTDPRWREIILQTASMLENADGFFKLFQESINHLISKESMHKIVRAFSKVPDRRSLMQLQMITLLYYTVVSSARGFDIWARNRYGEYSLFDQSFNEACATLGVEFPLPIFQLAVKGDRRRIVNLEYAIGLIGPRIPDYLSPEFKLDLNLIYLLIVAQHLSRLGDPDPVDFAALNLEFLDYFNPVLEMAIPADDMEMRKDWVELKEVHVYIFWPEVVRFLVKVVLKHRPAAQGGDVSEAHIAKLKDYIYCSDLLFECLQVAAVSNRKTIENNVYSFSGGFSSLRVST